MNKWNIGLLFNTLIAFPALAAQIHLDTSRWVTHEGEASWGSDMSEKYSAIEDYYYVANSDSDGCTYASGDAWKGGEYQIQVNDAGCYGGAFGEAVDTNILMSSSFEWSENFLSEIESNYSFDFNVNAGALGTFFNSSNDEVLSVGSSFSAGYSLSILLDGESVWSSEAILTTKDGVTQVSTSGESIGGNFSTNVNDRPEGSVAGWIDSTDQLLNEERIWAWSNGMYNVDLGTLAANTLHTLSYQVTVNSSSYVAGAVGDSHFGAYGGYAIFRDPFWLTGGFNLYGNEVVSDVVEPSMAGLMLIGLLGFFARVNRRSFPWITR